MRRENHGAGYDAPVTSLSDPSRAGRRDRRKAQKSVDAAYAGGQLSAADRALRTQRIEAAQTKGELAMITRDLAAPPPPQPAGEAAPKHAATPSLGSALDPAVLESMRVKSTHSTSMTAAPALRRIAVIVIIVVAGMVLVCGLGVVGVVVSAISGAGDPPAGTTTATPSADITTGAVTAGPGEGLHSAGGWRSFVAAVQSESGTTEVYDAVVYPEYAAVALVSGDGTERRVFRDGAFLDSFRVQTEAVGGRVDLAQIEPDVIAGLPQATADQLGVDTPTDAYLIINALPTEPRIIVYVQANGSSQYRMYTLDGTPVE